MAFLWQAMVHLVAGNCHVNNKEVLMVVQRMPKDSEIHVHTIQIWMFYSLR
jgi:hypothetical protein